MAGIGGKGIIVGVVVAILVVSVVLAAIMTGFRSAPKVEKPPTAPTGLQAVSGDGQITLTWQPPANTGSSAIKGYRVYRSTSPGTETPQMDIGNMQRYIDGNLNNGQPYYYKVSAVNSMGEGPLSNEASAVPGTNATAPSEPRNLAASAGDAKVSLSWIAPQSDGGSPILTYIVYRGVAAGAESYLTDAGNSLNYVNTGLVNNITYFYKVGARNAAGEGPRSASVNATPTGNAVMPGA
jgi:fibronectin type 3 domain-containing protein